MLIFDITPTILGALGELADSSYTEIRQCIAVDNLPAYRVSTSGVSSEPMLD